MNEQQIETRVERIMDRWDKLLMAGSISQEDYDREIEILDRWANQQYRALKPAPFKEDFLHYE